MSDLDHEFGADLSVDANGDLALASGSVFGRQRVLRRLLTNSGGYIWNLGYGAGLPGLIGTPSEAAAIRGLVLNQIVLESAVARNPAPEITIQATADVVSLSITYADTTDASTQTLGIALSE